MKIQFRNRYLFLVVLLIIAIGLAGCSKTAAPAKESNSSTAAPTKEGSSSEKVKLTIGHFWVDDDGILFRNTLDEYRKENPNVNLVEEAIPHDPYRIKMTTLGASGDFPDLFVANGSMLIDYIPKGYAGSFNEELDKDPQWKEGFLPNSFDEFTTGGKIYGIPTALFSAHLIYYNKDIFNKVGITSFPQTWDEFTAAIKKLKDNNYTPIAMGNKSNVPVGSVIFGTLADRFTGTDWFKAMKEHKAKFTDPDFVKALTTLQDLAKMGAFNPDINSIDNTQAHSLYFNKQAAMTIDGAWELNDVVKTAPDDVRNATALAVLPAVPGGKGDALTVAGGSGWAFSYNAKLTGAKKDAAMKLIKKLSSEPYGKLQIENNGQPAVKVSDYDHSKLSPLAVDYFKLMSDKKYSPIYDIQLSPALVEALYKGIQDLLIGGITPEELAKKVQTVQDAQR
jgi:raffinose/stachyose/melibiose transport system substrate-binding protein